MKVLLVCAMGMSTSILMKKLEKYAAEQGINFSIAAQSVNTYKTVCHEYDCILMGPQISIRRTTSPPSPAYRSPSFRRPITARATAPIS